MYWERACAAQYRSEKSLTHSGSMDLGLPSSSVSAQMRLRSVSSIITNVGCRSVSSAGKNSASPCSLIQPASLASWTSYAKMSPFLKEETPTKTKE